VIRLDEFKLSKRPYAVNMGSLTVNEHGRSHVDAVWFRRRSGLTVACAGTLWDYQDERPADAVAFLIAHDDGRYGGNAVARWDRSNLWAPQMPIERAHEYLAVLRPMLAQFPAIPEGWDGWWTFHG
jgi:hypothetical protein